MPVDCSKCGKWVELDELRESPLKRNELICKECYSEELRINEKEYTNEELYTLLKGKHLREQQELEELLKVANAEIKIKSVPSYIYEKEYPNDDWKVLVKYLHKYSIKKNITQDQIAQKIGIDKSNVSRIFSTRYKPSFPIILNIANVIGLNIVFEKIEKSR